MVSIPLHVPAVFASTTAAPVPPSLRTASTSQAEKFGASLAQEVAQGRDGASATTHSDPAGSPTGTQGDAILVGMERLRGVFSAHEARIADLASGPLDAETLLATQVHMANFSILIDTTSKLSSKATQVLDTLMKG